MQKKITIIIVSLIFFDDKDIAKFDEWKFK